MKPLFYLSICLMLLSCNSPATDLAKHSNDSLPETKNLSEGICILKNWTNAVHKDSIYSLQIKGKADSIAAVRVIIGKGGVIKNLGNGSYEFKINKNVDSTSIMIIKGSYSPSAKRVLERPWATYKMRVIN